MKWKKGWKNLVKVVVSIPCYNESKTIGNIIARCKKYADEVVVVDDQSEDDTSLVALNSGAVLVITSGKHGPGKAYALGISKALELGADIIVTLDGDGQHDPEEIPNLLSGLSSNDVVITSRFLDDSTRMPLYRRVGNWIITFVYNVGSKKIVTDSQCGFRAFRSKVFEDIKLTERGFGYSTELLIKLRCSKLIVEEIPACVKYFDDFSNNSSMNPMSHGLSVLKDTIKWRVKCELLNVGWSAIAFCFASIME